MISRNSEIKNRILASEGFYKFQVLFFQKSERVDRFGQTALEPRERTYLLDTIDRWNTLGTPSFNSVFFHYPKINQIKNDPRFALKNLLRPFQ